MQHELRAYIQRAYLCLRKSQLDRNDSPLANLNAAIWAPYKSTALQTICELLKKEPSFTFEKLTFSDLLFCVVVWTAAIWDLQQFKNTLYEMFYFYVMENLPYETYNLAPHLCMMWFMLFQVQLITRSRLEKNKSNNPMPQTVGTHSIFFFVFKFWKYTQRNS